MNCEEFEELSGAYALDAVTPAEREEAETHLAQCDKCTRLLQELRSVVTLLPLSVPRVDPSQALQERILTAIRKESTRTPIQLRQPPQRRRRVRWSPGALVAAALLMFSLLGGMTAWNISLNHQVTALHQQVVQLSKQHTFPPSVPTYTVNGTTSTQRVTGELLYFPQQNITVLIMRNLPKLQGLQVYQGWLLQLKGLTPVGVKSIGLLNIENGTASIAFPGNFTGYNAAAVSLEPGPKATLNAPKGRVVALGMLKYKP